VCTFRSQEWTVYVHTFVANYRLSESGLRATDKWFDTGVFFVSWFSFYGAVGGSSILASSPYSFFSLPSFLFGLLLLESLLMTHLL
jgi:hypothetical protein